jgi:hypothetical protein
MEFLFDNKRQHTVDVPAFSDGDVNGVSEDSPALTPMTSKGADIRFLIKWMLDNLLVDRARSDLFVQGETVCGSLSFFGCVAVFSL